MAQTLETLPVIFRAERSGDFKGEVTAVFPTLPHDGQGRYFTVYQHIGQHGSGSHDWYRDTRAAKPDEYADLLAELTRIYGRPDPVAYRLKVAQKMTPQHRRAFNDEVQRMRRVDRALTARERGESVPLGTFGPIPASTRQLTAARAFLF